MLHSVHYRKLSTSQTRLISYLHHTHVVHMIVYGMELDKTRWSCSRNCDQNCTQNFAKGSSGGEQKTTKNSYISRKPLLKCENELFSKWHWMVLCQVVCSLGLSYSQSQMVKVIISRSTSSTIGIPILKIVSFLTVAYQSTFRLALFC